MTMIVPKAIDKATSRFGFLTSAAVKPMLFQASAENSEPTCETASANNKPYQPLAAVTVGKIPRKRPTPGEIALAPRMAQRWVKLSAMAEAFLPTKRHRKIRPSSARTFAEVKTF